MAQTVEMLNQKYGSPGRIVFREGPGGMPVVVLASPHGVCEVSLYGGQVLSYRAKGYTDALWLSPLANFAEGAAIRGGVPVCWPWFGVPPADYPQGTPTHGFARKALWRVIESSYAAADTELVLALTQKEATCEAWPHAYQLRLTINLGEHLKLDLETTNVDTHPFTYSQALHAYFRVADVEQVELIGVTPAALTFDTLTTYDVIHPTERGLAIVRDPVMERNLNVVSEHATAFVIWQPALDNGMADVPLSGAKKFLCVEPATPHHDDFTPVTLQPGERHTLTLKIQPSELK